MDYYLGGDLYNRIKTNNGPLTENEVRFYMTEVVLGLSYLHENQILYRDLKVR